MTHEQHIASSHWSMYARDGFPIRKLKTGKWLLSIEPRTVWEAIGSFSMLFTTKKAAQEFFDNLCLIRFREWKEESTSAARQLR